VPKIDSSLVEARSELISPLTRGVAWDQTKPALANKKDALQKTISKSRTFSEDGRKRVIGTEQILTPAKPVGSAREHI